MAQITKVVMISEFTTGEKEEAYWDQLTVKSDSISYEYKPKVPTEENRPEKWYRRGVGERFEMLWEQFVAKMNVVLKMESDDERGAYEGPGFEVRVTFDDGSRKTLKFLGSGHILTGLSPIIDEMTAISRNIS